MGAKGNLQYHVIGLEQELLGARHHYWHYSTTLSTITRGLLKTSFTAFSWTFQVALTFRFQFPGQDSVYLVGRTLAWAVVH